MRRVSCIAVLLLAPLLSLAQSEEQTGHIICAGDLHVWHSTVSGQQQYFYQASDTVLAYIQSHANSRFVALGDIIDDSPVWQILNSLYDSSYGRVKSSTYPVFGTHDGGTPGSPILGDTLAMYFGSQYMGDNNWMDYAVDLSQYWRLMVLNSDMFWAGASDTAKQHQWIRAELAAHPTKRYVVAFHRSAYSSATHGDNTYAFPYFPDFYGRVFLMLSGHDHCYERFADRNGGRDSVAAGTGVRQYTCSIAPNFYSFEFNAALSQVRNNTEHTLLTFELGQSYYSWDVLTLSGAFVDSGTVLFGSHNNIPAVAVTLSADSVTGTTAKLTGSVNPNNSSTTVTFEYGTTTSYGSSVTASESPVSGTSPVSVSAGLTGLVPSTLYHFRVVAVNAGGTTNGADSTFTTPAVLPVATTLSAGSVTGTTATLTGSVNANNASTTVTFEYGTTTSYGSSVTASESPVSGTSPVSVSAGLTALVPSTLYHFRVVAVNAGGTTNGADSTFTTPAVLPVATTLSADSISGTTATLTGSVNPNNASTVVRFHYWITTGFGDSVDASPSPVGGSVPVSVSAPLAGLAPNTVYYYRVVAVNAAGTSYGGDSTFTTLVAAPSAPLLGYAANHAVDQPTSLTLGWHPVSTAARFRLQVGTDSTFATGLAVDDTSLVDTLRLVDGLANDTKYYWRVAAENAGGIGDWSERWDFTTIVPLPEQVVPVAPLDQSTATADTVICAWGSAQPNVTHYQFVLATDSLFTAVLVDSSLADTTLIIRGLANNTSNWWRVQAENVAGFGPWSAGWEFRVNITSVTDANGIPTDYVLYQNYPNPFNPSTTIRYDLPSSTHVTLKVYNTLGQEVATVVDETQEPGHRSAQFDASDLPSGVYLYRVQAGDFVQSKKLILLR